MNPVYHFKTKLRLWICLHKSENSKVMVTTLTLCGMISYWITVYIVKSVFQCYKERWQTLNYHVLNVVISLHSQIIVAHNLVTDYPSRLRILLQHFLPPNVLWPCTSDACLSSWQAAWIVLLLCCYRASTPLACSHDSGFYSLYQYCYCQYWKCTSIAAQIILLPNSHLVCSFSCWDFLLIPSGLQNHFGSSHLAHYIVVVTFFCSHCTEQENCLQYLYRVTCIFCLRIYDSVFKRTKTQTLFETCLPDKSNCHCICCLPPLLHFSPWVICTLY